MGKYGKKVVVSKNMNDFMLGLCAPSGFGKSTLMYKVCDKLYGESGYILADFGDENGTAALNGAVAERVPTWKKFKEMVDDIVKNKESDYADLRVLVIDTLDAAYSCCEQFTVATYNREHLGEQNFRQATSINNCEGGYGRGMDRCVEFFKKEIIRLNSVGVGVWWTAHVKEKDQVDLFTGNSFTQLTASMSTKYFNSIKDISHVIGCGFFDRSINTVEVGEANPVTKKKKTRKAMESEERKILFRDSSMVADGKSRFSHIVDEINLSADEWIEAIQSAIDAERGDAVDTLKTPTPAPTPEPPADTAPFDLDEEGIEMDSEPVDIDSLMADIRASFKVADADTKKKVKAILTECGNGKLEASLGADTLLKIKDILEA